MTFKRKDKRRNRKKAAGVSEDRHDQQPEQKEKQEEEVAVVSYDCAGDDTLPEDSSNELDDNESQKMSAFLSVCSGSVAVPSHDGKPSYKLDADETQRMLAFLKAERRSLNSKKLQKLMPNACKDLKDGKVDPYDFAQTIAVAYGRKYLPDELPKACMDLKYGEVNPYDFAETIAWAYGRTYLPVKLRRTHDSYFMQEADDAAALVLGFPQDHSNSESVVAWFYLSENFHKMFLDLMESNIHEMPPPVRNRHIELAVDRECIRAASFVDDLLYEGTQGTFLQKCRTVDVSDKISEQFEKNDCQANFLLVVARTVQRATRDAVYLYDKEHKLCWWCEEKCKSVIYCCGSCEVALYCGRGCQKKGWKAGHKNACKLLPIFQTSLKNMWEAVQFAHSKDDDGEEYKHLVLNEQADYAIYHHFVAEGSLFHYFDFFHQAPSMKVFYQNLNRVMNQGWWFFQCLLFDDGAKEEKLDDIDDDLIVLWYKLAGLLCFDWFELANKKFPGKLDPMTSAAEFWAESGAFQIFLGPRRITANQFLQMYWTYNGWPSIVESEDCQLELQFLKRVCETGFRVSYHTLGSNPEQRITSQAQHSGVAISN
jgi:hypothetical protein